MQTLYKDEAITIAPNLDGYLLSDFQHTLGDLSDGFWLERCATLYRYVDARDREFFSPHHFTFPIECQAARQQRNNVSLRDVSVLPEIPESGMCHFGVSNPRVVPIVGERNHGSRGRRASACSSKRPDLILMGVQLPIMDGYGASFIGLVGL